MCSKLSLPIRVSAVLLAGAAIAAPPLVIDQSKISDDSGGFEGTLDPDDIFGSAVDGIGDLNGDGIGDIVVGAPLDDDGDFDAGAVWVLFLNRNGTVDEFEKISDIFGDFDGILAPTDEFGTDVAAIGDLDGDGIEDIIVGAPYDDDGNEDAGAIWVLFLHDDGTVKDFQKISDIVGDFEGILLEGDTFGFGIDDIGDFDGNGVVDIAVGAPFDDDGDGVDKGAVWILFLNRDGTVKDYQKISEEEGGFRGDLSQGDTFGTSVAALGDVDGDGVTDLAVGAPLDDDGDGADVGAVWILFLEQDGTVKAQRKISNTQGGFEWKIDAHDWFGWAVAGIGDVDGDDVPDLGVGNPLDDDGNGADKGAVFVLLLKTDGTVKEAQKISEEHGNFTGDLDEFDVFGTSFSVIGDVNDDGADDFAIGAAGDNDGGGINSGALWVLFMEGTPVVPDCGDPDASGSVTASDALTALKTAVGSAECAVCVCDVDSSGTIAASDAQRILKVAVGTVLELQCVACG
jgi:hypothetical protein